MQLGPAGKLKLRIWLVAAEYKFGSMCNPDPGVREMATPHLVGESRLSSARSSSHGAYRMGKKSCQAAFTSAPWLTRSAIIDVREPLRLALISGPSPPS